MRSNLHRFTSEFKKQFLGSLVYKNGAVLISMMIEIAKRTRKDKGRKLLDVYDVLGKDNACYVLITCGEPAEDGKMQVEMTYEGDRSLAAFLIESAQDIIDHQENMSS